MCLEWTGRGKIILRRGITPSVKGGGALPYIPLSEVGGKIKSRALCAR